MKIAFLKYGLLPALCIVPLSPANSAWAQTSPDTSSLGQIEIGTVTAQQAAPIAMSANTLSNDTISTYHGTSLNQTLDMMPVFLRSAFLAQGPTPITALRGAVGSIPDNRKDHHPASSSDYINITAPKGI